MVIHRAMDEMEPRFRDVIRDIFHDLGQMKGHIPKIGPFRAAPLSIYNGEPSSDTLQHVAIFFVHSDGSLERVGVLSPSVLLTSSRDETLKPILYFSLRLDFIQNFWGSATIHYSQEVMLEITEIIRHHFEILNDRSIAVYFEHCNRFLYHKVALCAGSIPGWVSHQRSAGRGYRGMKGHWLYIMDRFLHCDHLSAIPREDLIPIYGEVVPTDIGPTLVPRGLDGNRMTTLSFVRLWNCNINYEYVYDMQGKFWLESAPEESKRYIAAVKKASPERVITIEEVRHYLKDYAKAFKEYKQ
ncbi:MAG: hypothetical protein LBB11_01030 [Puniceicoccales bacterium]|jgi:hypothetical protein|nr:hypothetical protein [Puniceicoccales bacterium]